MVLCIVLLCSTALARPDCQMENAKMTYSLMAQNVQQCYWQAANHTANYIYALRPEDRPKSLATTYVKIRFRRVQRGN